MKLKLNFDFLRRVVFMAANGADPHIQRYDITIVQGWLKEDLREDMDHQLINPESGWSQPSFRTKGDYALAMTSLVNREMFNNSIAPEFLTYRQRAKTNLQIIKKIRVKGHQDENLVTGSEAVDNNPVQGATPEQNFSFNWDLSKFNKTKMAPIGSETVADPERVLAYSWIPYLQVQVARRVLESTGSTGGPNENRSYLIVKHINHFTYADS
jgi:hypothetical protein